MANIVFGDSPECKIQKKVLFFSKKPASDFPDDTKVYFRYQTKLCNSEHTVLDDNRKDLKPLEMIIGKKFKLEVWETCLKSMRPEEVSSFTVDASLVGSYPMLAKSLREIRCGHKHVSRHCCGMTVLEHGLGYSDLDDLLKEPQPLEFIFEIVRVEEPGNYNKDTWAMGDGEKLDRIPQLKEEGNELFKQKNYEEAANKYGQALGLLDQLALVEKPGEEEYNSLEQKKLPFLLNYSQCKLILNDFYPVIEQTTEVLKRDPDNVKALFRRGKAHIGAWNPSEARQDFERVIQLDASLINAANKQLNSLTQLEKEKSKKDQDLLKGKLFK